MTLSQKFQRARSKCFRPFKAADAADEAVEEAPRGRAGGAGEAALIDDDHYATHSMHGVAHAAAFMMKAAATVDGVRHKSPGTGYPGTLLWYTKAAKETVKRRPLRGGIGRGATIPGSKR